MILKERELADYEHEIFCVLPRLQSLKSLNIIRGHAIFLFPIYYFPVGIIFPLLQQ